MFKLAITLCTESLRNNKEVIVMMRGMCQECELWLLKNKPDKEASPIQAGVRSCVFSHVEIGEIFVLWTEKREGRWFGFEHWISKHFYGIKRWSSILMGFDRQANLFTLDLWKEGLKVQPIDIWLGGVYITLQGLNNDSLSISVHLFTREKCPPTMRIWSRWYNPSSSFSSTYFP